MKKNNIIFFSSLVLVYLVATLTISNINGSYAASTPESFVIECMPLDGSGAKIYYNTNGGNVIESSSVCKTCGIREFPALPVPTKSDASFAGWYYDEKLTKKVEAKTIDEVKTNPIYDSKGCYIRSEVTLYAKWTADYITDVIECKNLTGGGFKIIYNTNGGNKIEDANVCKGCGPSAYSNLPTPTKSDYIFAGWYYDSALTKKVTATSTRDVEEPGHYDSNGCYIPDGKVTLYAKWIKIEHNIDCSSILITGGSLEIIYNTNGGNKLESTKYCGGCNPENQPKTLSTPTKSGYIFDGWYYDEALTKKVEGTSPSDVKSSGHYDSNGCYIPDNKVTLYAKWSKKTTTKTCNTKVNNKFTLTYKVSNSQNLTKEICIGCSDNPAIIDLERNGYVFAGWYYDSALTKKVETENTSDIKVSKKYDKNNCHIGYKNVTLYPKWIEKNVCKEEKTLTISFDTLGGSNIEDIKIKSKEFTVFKIDPEIPTKENYTFVGWYYDSGLTNKVDTNALTLNNNNTNCEDVQITLYAKYTSVDTAVLKGKIVNSNNAVLAYTKVTLDDELETLTDDNGYYELENVSDGNHELTIKDINDNIISKTTISILNQTGDPEDEYTLTYTKDKNMISANIRIDKSGNIEFIKTDTKSTNSLIIIAGLIIVVIMAVIINQNNNAEPKDDEELDAE